MVTRGGPRCKTAFSGQCGQAMFGNCALIRQVSRCQDQLVIIAQQVARNTVSGRVRRDVSHTRHAAAGFILLAEGYTGADEPVITPLAGRNNHPHKGRQPAPR
jgi:hypothetical protein